MQEQHVQDFHTNNGTLPGRLSNYCSKPCLRLPSEKSPLSISVLSPKLKNQLVNILKRDNARTLKEMICEGNVTIRNQVGPQGFHWTLFHLAAKEDAVSCLQFMANFSYQISIEEYQNVVNAKTVQGYTPLMIAVMYYSDKIVQTLLNLGGVDIYAIDSRKMTIYNIADAYHNQRHVKAFQSYEVIIKDKIYINHNKLRKKTQFKQSLSIRQRISRLFTYCLPVELGQLVDFSLDNMRSCASQDQSLMKSNINNKHPIVQFQWLDVIETDWKSALDSNGRQLPLFGAFQKGDIHQDVFYLNRIFGIIKQMCAFPQLLKNIIKQKDDGNFLVQLNYAGCEKEITVNNTFPYAKHSQQPLFVSSQSELWPMVLTKALAQLYGGYFQIDKIAIPQLLTDTTGFLTKVLSVSTFITMLVQNLIMLPLKGYLTLLVSPQQTRISNRDSTVQSFYLQDVIQIGEHLLFLVNCPFFFNPNHLRVQNQDPTFKLQIDAKRQFLNSIAHQKSCNQVWLTKFQFMRQFELVILCEVNTCIKRSKYLFRSMSNVVYIKYEIGYSQSLKIYFKVFSKSTGKVLRPKECSGWLNDGASLLSLVSQKDYIWLETSKGSHFVRIVLQDSPEQGQELAIVGWSRECLLLKALDEEIGELDYIDMLKNNMVLNQFSRDKISFFTSQHRHIVFVRSRKSQCIAKFNRLNNDQNDRSCIYQGKLVELQHEHILVSLTKIQESELFYSVLSSHSVSRLGLQLIK